MKIKNGKLIMYDISEDYREYLRKYDKKVSKKDKRKFYGILITKDNIDYYIPITSKIDKKTNSKLTISIKDKGNRTIAKLLLNNMIPVNEKNACKVDIKNSKYKDYFNKELIYLRKKRVINEILRKTENIFNVLEDSHNLDYNFFKDLCCDFKLLEEKCMKYNRKNHKLNSNYLLKK